MKKFIKLKNINKINNIKNQRILITENSLGSQNPDVFHNNYGCFENSTWYYPGQKINNMALSFSIKDYHKSQNKFKFFFNFQTRNKGINTFEIKDFFYERGS